LHTQESSKKQELETSAEFDELLLMPEPGVERQDLIQVRAVIYLYIKTSQCMHTFHAWCPEGMFYKLSMHKNVNVKLKPFFKKK
jgi:hypothetical protein